MATITTTDDITTETDLCLGPVRWVPLSPMQAHRRKLQQLWQVRRYIGSRPVEVIEEWRDVPDGDY